MVNANLTDRCSFDVTSELQNVEEVSSRVSVYLENHDAGMKAVMRMSVAIDEIFANISRYGYKGTVGTVTIDMGMDGNVFYLSFKDNAPAFNPLEKDDPDVNLSLEERDVGGLGIYIVKNSMDDVLYEYLNNQNVLTLVKTIN